MNTLQIDTVVIVKTLILDRNKSMLQIDRNLVDRHVFTVGTGCNERCGLVALVVQHGR